MAVPGDRGGWTASYRKFSPDWEIKRQGDTDLPELAGKVRRAHLVLDESLGMGIRCDVTGCEIVRLFGGLYLDHDMEIFRPLFTLPGLPKST